MKRLVAYLLALALAFPAQAGVLGVSSGVLGVSSNPPGSSSEEVDPTPVFDFNPGEYGSGVNLLTDDGLGQTVVILGDARTGSDTNWPLTTGGTWTEQDAYDVDFDCATCAAPFTEILAESADYDRFASHEAPNTTVGQIGSGVDFSMIWIGSLFNRGALQQVFGNVDATNSQGIGIQVTSGGVLQAKANGTTVGSYQLDAFDEFNIIEFRRDGGDTCSLSVNGYLVGSTASCSGSLETTTAAKKFTVGCKADGTNEACIDGKVVWFRVATGTGSVANRAAIVQKHAQQIMGVWPSAAVTFAPSRPT